MAEKFFEIIEEPNVRVIRFMLPDHMDPMEIDTVIQAVLDRLTRNTGGLWIVDLTDVHYLGSAMLGLMVNIRERVRQTGGKLVLAGLSPQILRIFQACCLERLFVISKTRAEATKMVQTI